MTADRPTGPMLSRGLADGDVGELRDRVLGAWDAFRGWAADLDLRAPSRLPGWSAGDVLIHLGSWPGNRPLQQLLDAARGVASDGAPDQDTANAAVLRAHRGADDDAVHAALAAAQEGTAAFFTDGLAAEVGGVEIDSMVGPLPVLTLVHAAGYELAVHALDIRTDRPPPDELLIAGLGAVLDVTGALAARQGLTADVAAQTPVGGWRFTSGPDGWGTTPVPAGPVSGTAVLGSPRHLLDVSAGRANAAVLVARGALRVQSMSSFLRLAPLVEAVPALPGGSALRAAAGGLSGVGQMLGRLPGRPRLGWPRR